MKRILLALILLCSTAQVTRAQTTVTIDDLTAPTSPGFVLLDVSPASVERPETPKAFTLNLLNKLATTKGLPQNYALEVAPYWMADHPTLTFHKYQRPTPWQSIAQTFSVSVATVPIPGATATADPTGTRLGLGVRTSIINGRPNPTLEDLVKALQDVDDEILNAVNAGRPVDPELRTKAREAAAAIQAADAERVGVFLVVAAGQTWGFPNDDVEKSERERRGFWVTPSYRLRACNGTDPCESMLDVIGVVRGLKDKDQDWAWDYGGRLVWRPKREFNVSIESLERRKGATASAASTAESSRTSTRTVGLLEYRIHQDLVLYGSFGRDFKSESGIRPLVSILGLNIGLGSKATVKPDEKSQ